MTPEPLDHVVRLSPPWRKVELTECGKNVAEFAEGRVLGREEMAAKAKRQGKQRTAMTMCMTCWGKFQYNWHGTWDEHPEGVVERDVGGFGRRRSMLADELKALSILYSRHTDEYDAIVAGLAETEDLAEKRAERRLRRA